MNLSLTDRLEHPEKQQQKIPLTDYDPRHIARYSAKVPPPPTQEIYEEKQSRFEKNT